MERDGGYGGGHGGGGRGGRGGGGGGGRGRGGRGGGGGYGGDRNRTPAEQPRALGRNGGGGGGREEERPAGEGWRRDSGRGGDGYRGGEHHGGGDRYRDPVEQSRASRWNNGGGGGDRGRPEVDEEGVAGEGWTRVSGHRGGGQRGGGYGGDRYQNTAEQPRGGRGRDDRGVAEKAGAGEGWRMRDSGRGGDGRGSGSQHGSGGYGGYQNPAEQSRDSWRNTGGGGDGRGRSEVDDCGVGKEIVAGEGSTSGSGRGATAAKVPGVDWQQISSAQRQPHPTEPRKPSTDSPVSGKQISKAANQLFPVQRPDKGGLNSIRSVKLRVNHFLVKYNAKTIIMHYNVDVKPETPSKHGRPVRISKPDLSMIRDKLFSDNPSKFPLSATAYDCEKNIFSAVRLPTGMFKVDVSKGEDTDTRSYTVSINLVNELKLGKLDDYLRGCLPSIPRDILQGMDLVMKENPTKEMISVGRNFYPKVPDSRDDLGHGICAYKGFQHSLKPTSQGLSLCLDFSVLAFRKRMPVIEFLRQHIDGFSPNEFGRFRRDVENALRGLKVYVNHRRTSQKFIVKGLTDKTARNSSFDIEDPDGNEPPRRVFLVQYFKEKYDKNIVHVDIPCLDLGKQNKRNDVPMEFCELVEGQRYHKELLDKDAAQHLKTLSLPFPRDRENLIRNMVQSSYGPCGGGIAKNFGIDVNMNMTAVEGRVIGPPELKLGGQNGKLITVSVDRDKCHWNLVNKSVVQGKPIDKWAVLDFRQNERGYNRFDLDPNEFIPKLINRCEKLGIRMAEPLFYERTSMRKFSSADMLRELLEGISHQAYKCCGGRLQLLVCAMNKRDPGYKLLKWICETKIGIVTQCCLSSHATKASDQYLANLALKINAKLGGSNVELSRLPIPAGAGHVMFVGADVNHPTGGTWNSTSPSIAAVVASVNWPAANRYAARVRAQRRRCEEILDFGDMCLDLIESYVLLNRVRPEKIIIFRDGVSDGQFDMVLNEELLDLRRALATINYAPTITLIVAQKRHQTRLFPQSKDDGCSTGNVPPGTVVDTRVVHPFEFDFYLCSHYGSLGTSKPTHYHVLYDEHRFTSDQLQKLIYDMCFTMARCTKPVSLVPPVYYADLAAYRGRIYHEAVTEWTSPPSGGSSSSSLQGSSSSVASFDERFFKLHADLENEMFFV